MFVAGPKNSATTPAALAQLATPPVSPHSSAWWQKALHGRVCHVFGDVLERFAPECGVFGGSVGERWSHLRDEGGVCGLGMRCLCGSFVALKLDWTHAFCCCAMPCGIPASAVLWGVGALC